MVYWSRSYASGSQECFDPHGNEPASSHVDQSQMVLQELMREPQFKAEVGAILTWGGVVHSLCVCHTHMLTSATNDGPQH